MIREAGAPPKRLYKLSSNFFITLMYHRVSYLCQSLLFLVQQKGGKEIKKRLAELVRGLATQNIKQKM